MCKEGHPTALHKRDEVGARATHTDDVESNSAQISMPILPVKIYHESDPNRYAIVYAMLYICSSGVFLLQDCADELGVEIRRTPVNIKTVIGEHRGVLNTVEGLMVKSARTDEKTAVPFPLPKAYCKDTLSIDHEEIITLQNLQKWRYLKALQRNFTIINRISQ